MFNVRELYASIGIKFDSWIKFEGCKVCGGTGYSEYSSFDGHRTDHGKEQCYTCEIRAEKMFLESAKKGMESYKRELSRFNVINPDIKTRAEDF